MLQNNLKRFFFSIIFPSILAIALFVLSIFVVILPKFERSIMEQKKEMISELTKTAWSLLEEYDAEYENGNFTLEEAQKQAASRIERMRYGGESKDYFWIIDQHPNMIMHPYRGELTQTDLSDYQDPNGVKLFMKAVEVVKESGEGYIDYMWQWKDDSTKIVPKLSYVRGFKPWGWIIGTGIYLEDVKAEIRGLKKRLLTVSFVITFLIIVILLFGIRQSLNIENKRKDAEEKLLQSRQRYKSLVEASTEGTLMIVNQKIIYSNIKFSNLIGYSVDEILKLSFEDIFQTDWEQLKSSFTDPKKTISLETGIKCKDGKEKEVIISASSIQQAETRGYVIITKEISRQKQIERDREYLSQELQSALLLMSRPIKHFEHGIIKCSLETSIADAAKLMTRKRQNVLFIHKDGEIIGAINNSDFKKRAIAENKNLSNPVMEIMSAPVVSISENALLYEAVLLLRNKNISHLAVKNDKGAIEGVVSFNDIIGTQQNSVSYLIKEIEIAEDIDQLKKIHNRVPVLVNALIESGDKTRNITRIITSVSDAITKRVLDLAIENLGAPPCRFSFVVMGSEGRMEQTLTSDQDNAIIIENLKNEELSKAYVYFQKLGEIVCRDLNSVGYQYCKGDIMAQNPKWTQPLAIWKEYFFELDKCQRSTKHTGCKYLF
jgi:PAS domain S-box-containing protein